MFYQENCEYLGIDLGLSPPDGEVKNEMECQEFCKIFQDFGCLYWTFEVINNTINVSSRDSKSTENQTVLPFVGLRSKNLQWFEVK